MMGCIFIVLQLDWFSFTGILEIEMRANHGLGFESLMHCLTLISRYKILPTELQLPFVISFCENFCAKIF